MAEFDGKEFSKASVSTMTVFATSYFPSCEYLKELCLAKESTIDIGEHYLKQTFRNRCCINTGQGIQNLSIPVIRPQGNKTATKDIVVTEEINWRRDHWRTIKAAYSSAPYFEHYESEVKNLIFQETEKLVEFNHSILKWSISSLELPISVAYSNEYVENEASDFRNFQFVRINSNYAQVIFDQHDFIPELSFLDAIFCLGPMARNQIFSPIYSNS